MAGQVEFMEAIQELEHIGETNGNQLTMEEIRQYFAEMDLDEAQFDFICKYYEGHNIHIINRVEKLADEISEEDLEMKEDPLDAEMVAIYMKEAEHARTLSADQMEELAQHLTAEDEEGKNLLIEANLKYAIELAKQYKGRGLQISDLIQESNIGLVMAVHTYEAQQHGPFVSFVETMIRSQVEDALDEYRQSTRSAMKMASRVNEMNEIATAFAKEYDREAKPEEIASRMGITEEEVRELMKISLDAIAVLNENKMGN